MTKKPTSPGTWGDWLERLYDLRRDKRGSHERPHKPALLLAIIDQLDRRELTDNEIRLSDDLIDSFRRQFEVVRKHDDQATIQNPFFHLSGDDFWQLVPQPGAAPAYVPGQITGAPSVAQLRRNVAFGRFDTGLWSLLCNPTTRHQLREALVARYFPDEREQLAKLWSADASSAHALHEQLPRERDAAFRRVILETYDFRCAACGIRIKLDDGTTLVEAAHLIPFNVSHDDRPNNGLALCRNHHWAMDGFLLAPCPDKGNAAGVWQVTPRLDDRIEGERALVELKGRRVIPPNDRQFYPRPEALQWRCERLTAHY